MVAYTNVLVVNKDQPFKTVPELIAYARANPGKLTYGSAGIGASNHLSGELLALRSGTVMTHVPYKGNAPAMTDAKRWPMRSLKTSWSSRAMTSGAARRRFSASAPPGNWHCGGL